ncbi:MULTISPECIES: hypothetical protein [Thermomonospora]|uniref:Uncharacterized protein n=1 Tax=Thermomonospora cellulosilytica TaxID=1411118 RepID=A0A7W3RAP4_9ACTN|nr:MULTISPECIES: hypothetical protein [Thermomonospora]MBA9005505.1 hypothetical protein [Thermomonospora cellulosilytica]
MTTGHSQAITRRSALGAALLGGAAVLAPAAAGLGRAEAGTRGLPHPPVLPITLAPEGFEFPGPNPRPAGMVTLKVDTPDPAGRFMGLGATRNGITFEQAMWLFWQSMSEDPAVAIPALQALYRDVEFFGGAGVFPATSPLSVTIDLPPDTYYGIEGEHFRQLQVTGPRRHTRIPRIDGVIRMVERDGRSRFITPRVMRARGTYLVVNQSAQPQEAVFCGVAPTTTERTVQDYFDAVAAGQNPPNPLLTQVGGLMAMSPGRKAILSFDFPPGRYSVLSFYRNPNTARKIAEEGMHRVVELR